MQDVDNLHSYLGKKNFKEKKNQFKILPNCIFNK